MIAEEIDKISNEENIDPLTKKQKQTKTGINKKFCLMQT